jgi:hypothetical protein
MQLSNGKRKGITERCNSWQGSIIRQRNTSTADGKNMDLNKTDYNPLHSNIMRLNMTVLIIRKM